MPATHKYLSAFALSALLFAGCGDDGAAADASPIDAPPPGGTFSLAWSVTDGTNPLLCDDVGAVSVSVTVVEQGGFGGSVDAFTCSGGQATSRRFSPGTYNLTIDLRASGSRSLIAAPVLVQDVQITANTDSPLAAQTFVVTPSGGFTFFVDGQGTAGNCETVANSGAGITGLEFALLDDADVCVAATFDVAAGVGAGTYTSVCPATPAALPCINADQLVTVNPIVSGSLALTIKGEKEAVANCYSRVSSFSVAGAMLVTELGSLPLILENTLECDPTNLGLQDAGPPDAIPPAP